MKITLFAYSRTGCRTARRVLAALPAAEVTCYAVPRLEEPEFLPLEKAAYAAAFSKSDALIFVGACGIAVREIAPYVQDKRTDPAVLCIDEQANFVIPLLSGHIGGANALALRLAAALGAQAAITTATDVNGKFSVDAWATAHACSISDMGLAKAVSAAILERPVPICSAFPLPASLPDGLAAESTGPLGIYIGYDQKTPFEKTLRLTPRILHVGIGCRRGISQEAVETAILDLFAEKQLDRLAISGIYTIDLKEHEPGLRAACTAHGWPLTCYRAAQLQAVPGSFTASAFVRSVTGVDNVCERAALLDAETLLVKKTACDGVTVAVAAQHWEVDFG